MMDIPALAVCNKETYVTAIEADGPATQSYRQPTSVLVLPAIDDFAFGRDVIMHSHEQDYTIHRGEYDCV
jgi:hypothetical protein